MSAEAHAVEQTLLDLLKGQFSTFSLSYNEHSVNYQSAVDAEKRGEFNHVDWVDERQKELAIRDNTVWLLHWYPNTPVSFYCIGASTLAACLEHVSKK